MATLGLIFAGTSLKFGYSRTQTNDLMLANIEALADNANEGTTTKKCGTKTKYINNLIPCSCGGKTGFYGLRYSYQKEGNDATYKEGECGTEISCTPYHGTKTVINTVKTHACE